MSNDSFETARLLALEAHRQQRYGDDPYSVHLEAVVGVLQRFGASLDDAWTGPILVAAWLHDAAEDTDLTLEQISSRLGEDVASLVWRVTDEPGQNRKQRKAATYTKTAGDERAILLKLADRIANVEQSKRTNPGLLQMYAREQAEFVQALRPACRSTIAERLWQHLASCFA